MTASVHMHGAESLRHHGLPPRPRSRRDVTPPLAAFRACSTRLQRQLWLRCRTETCDKTLVRSKMADGSLEDRAGPKQTNDLTFSAPDIRLGDTKKCSGETFDDDSVKLSFYKKLKTSESCENSDTRSVAADRAAAVETYSLKSSSVSLVDGDERKKRCFDRYDSSESSDRWVGFELCYENMRPRSFRNFVCGCDVFKESMLQWPKAVWFRCHGHCERLLVLLSRLLPVERPRNNARPRCREASHTIWIRD